MSDMKSMPKSFPWVYFFMNFGQMFGLAVAMSYLMIFLTNTAGISPVVVATILTLSRTIDFVASVIAGPIVQKSNSKAGQFRSWIVPCIVLVQVGVWMMFLNPNISLGAKAIIVGVGYVLQNAPMNFLVTATSGLMAKVAGPSMENRMAISAKIMQGMNAGNILVAMITLPLIRFISSSTGANGFLIVSIVYGLMMIGSSFIAFLQTKQYDQFNPNFKGAGGPSVGQIYGELLKNPMVWVLLCINILAMTSMFTIFPLGMYYFTYSVKNEMMQPVSMTIMSVVGLFAAFIMAPVARKIGKKNSALVSTGIAVVVQLLIGLFAHHHVAIYITLAAFNGFGAAILGVVGVNLWLDAAEYQLYKTGIDTRPTAMSMANIPMKIGMVFAGPLTAWMLGLAGFYQIFGDAGQLLEAGMTNPRAVSAIVFLIYLVGYKITDANAAEYAAANQKRMQERMAAAGGAPAGGPGGPPPGR